MKNNKVLFTVLAAALVLAMTACNNGGGGSPPPGGKDPTSTVYRSTDADGNIYELEIFKQGSRAAYSPKDGDDCVLTVYLRLGGKKTSTGTITVSGTTFTIKKGDIEFTITVSGDSIAKIEGESIPLDDNTTQAIPTGELTQASLFTLTGIPSEYEGKYVMLWGLSSDQELIGYHTDSGTGSLKLYKITNGSVTLRILKNYTTESYTGSGTFTMDIYINNTEDVYYTADHYVIFDNVFNNLQINAVKFANGAASAKWSDAVFGRQLVINGIPSTVFATFKANGVLYELYSEDGDTLYANSYNSPDYIGNDNTLTPGLFVPNAGNIRWLGKGSFVIWVFGLDSDGKFVEDNIYYAPIVISEQTTTIAWSKFEKW
jgi:hypothetical protein